MRRSVCLALVSTTLLLSRLAAQAPAAPATDYRAQALRILKTVPLVDGHNDIPDAIRGRGGVDSVDFGATQLGLMTDIPKLRAGMVGAQFWAAYVPVTTMHSGEHPAVYALEQIDLVRQLCWQYRRDLVMAYSADDIERNFKAGKISCLIGIEGGHAIESSLGALRMFYTLGVRYMTLTHWETTDWADAATDSAKHGGLTPFGEQVVHEMNRLGMLVDLSHVSDATMIDALRVSSAPVMFSHSSARALSNHVRNVPDSILKLVATEPRNRDGEFQSRVRVRGRAAVRGQHATAGHRAAGGRTRFHQGGGLAESVAARHPACHAEAGRRSHRAHPRRRRYRSRGSRI